MKTIVSSTLCAFAAAQWGSTGHYGGQMGHGGYDDHAHEDHIYGYDSVMPDLDIDQATNDLLATAIIDAINLAQADRVAYLEQVFDERKIRLDQIFALNEEKIKAPFEYQIELITEEQNDIFEAQQEAVKDVNDSWDDMDFRLQQLVADIKKEMDNEVTSLEGVLNRAVKDKKRVDKVFNALRIDWLRQLDATTGFGTTNTVALTEGRRDFSMYDGMFDNFHYDIGSSSGYGSGSPSYGSDQGYSGSASASW